MKYRVLYKIWTDNGLDTVYASIFDATDTQIVASEVSTASGNGRNTELSGFIDFSGYTPPFSVKIKTTNGDDFCNVLIISLIAEEVYL